MPILSKAILIAAMLAISTLAHSDGIYNPTAGGMPSFSGGVGGFEGPTNPTGAATGPATCSGTGLIFTSACNSQYIGIL